MPLLLLRNVKLGMNQKKSVALLQANIFIFSTDIKLGIIWQHFAVSQVKFGPNQTRFSFSLRVWVGG